LEPLLRVQESQAHEQNRLGQTHYVGSETVTMIVQPIYWLRGCIIYLHKETLLEPLEFEGAREPLQFQDHQELLIMHLPQLEEVTNDRVPL
jgi:hypothetical protein